MKKMVCPKCGKELVNISADKKYNMFWCDDCDMEIIVTNEHCYISQINVEENSK